MRYKNVWISWDKHIFDGSQKLLPNSKVLYTQIYDTPDIGDAWSIVFEFEQTPKEQGYHSVARVRFLVQEAPHFILEDGFKFDFLDGKKKIGECIIVE